MLQDCYILYTYIFFPLSPTQAYWCAHRYTSASIYSSVSWAALSLWRAASLLSRPGSFRSGRVHAIWHSSRHPCPLWMACYLASMRSLHFGISESDRDILIHSIRAAATLILHRWISMFHMKSPAQHPIYAVHLKRKYIHYLYLTRILHDILYNDFKETQLTIYLNIHSL